MATYNETQIITAFTDYGINSNVASLAVAQAKVESANFTSYVFNVDNNAFGYKYVGQLGATQGSPVPNSETEDGNPKYYAHYPNIYGSAVEMAKWLIRNVPNYENLMTPEDYANALANGKVGAYFGEPASAYATDMSTYFTPIQLTAFDKILFSGKYLNKNLMYAILGLAVVGSVVLYFVERGKKK